MTYACNTQPVPVAGGLAFTSIESGQYFACGLTASDTVYRWEVTGLGNSADCPLPISVVKPLVASILVQTPRPLSLPSL